VSIDLANIAKFPAPSVPGHRSELLIGTISGRRLAVQAGRVHLYEGFSPDEVVFGIRVYHELGLKTLLATNAAGSVSKKAAPGDVIAISDHINLTGVSCLAGKHRFTPSSFVSMHQCYSPRIRAIMTQMVGVTEGVYAGMIGPCFETRAEAKYLETIGADIVGMSTVQEVMCARHLGIEIAGLSFVTNEAGGSTSHREVLDSAQRHRAKLIAILETLLPRI
jgi:purine-nucleoside phosphorylase